MGYQQALFSLVLVFVTSACAGGPTPHEAKAQAPAAVPTPIPIPIPVPVPVPVPVLASPQVPPPVQASPPAVTIEKPKAVIDNAVWNLKNGKMLGSEIPPHAKIVAHEGNATDTCWNYGKFAVFESKVAGEVGAAEIYIRYAGERPANLCALEYPGRNVNLKIGEGYFAGVAGDYVVVEGADTSETLREFQLFSVIDGKEVYKAAHYPGEEFSITKSGKRSALVFFAKVKVSCELAEEGESCWKKVLLESHIPPTRMPDCKSSFLKAKTALTEPALVTVRMKVADLNSPKPQFIGGRASCSPEL